MSGESFNFQNGRSAANLEELMSVISDISDEEFNSYVSNSKNDFANWIEYSLDIKDLAVSIRPLVERELIKALISEFISKQKTLIIGTNKIDANKVIQEDSLVKEVMQKNDDFFKKNSASVSSEEAGNVSDSTKPVEEKHKDEKIVEHKKEDKKEEIKIPVRNVQFSEKKEEKKDRMMSISIEEFKRKLNRYMLVGLLFGLVFGALINLVIMYLIIL